MDSGLELSAQPAEPYGQSVEELREMVSALRQEVAAMRAELDNRPPPMPARLSRSTLLRGAGAIGVGAVATGVFGVGTALAKTSDNSFVATGVSNGVGFDAAARNRSGKPAFAEGVVGTGVLDGVRGTTDTGSGVVGYAYKKGAGVFGYGNPGVQGIARDAAVPASLPDVGVFGSGTDGSRLGKIGVQGLSDTSDGVLGTSSSGNGVHGTSHTTAGVFGEGLIGVHGRSVHGRGGVFDGVTAAIRLIPSSSDRPPSTGATGDVFVDNQGRLWFCRGGSRWHRIIG